MKNSLFALLALLSVAVAFTACNKNNDLAEDDQLIETIALSEARVAIEPSQLPAEAQLFIDERYFDTFVEEAYRVADAGYECLLGNQERLFFSLDGRFLQFRGIVRPNGPFGPNGPHGPCQRPNFALWQPVRVINLPACITDYVAANYPDATIVRAKTRAGHFVIGLNGPQLLRFDNNCNFVEEFTPVRPCNGQCNPLVPTTMPQPARAYIAANYPDATFVRACTRGGRIAVYMLNNGNRLILVFDADGNFLFLRG